MLRGFVTLMHGPAPKDRYRAATAFKPWTHGDHRARAFETALLIPPSNTSSASSQPCGVCRVRSPSVGMSPAGSRAPLRGSTHVTFALRAALILEKSTVILSGPLT